MPRVLSPKSQTFAPVRTWIAWMPPSAFPSMRSREPPMTPTMGAEYVVSRGFAPGSDHQTMDPVRLSKATYRWPPGPCFPQLELRKLMMTRPWSTTGVFVLPP